MSGFASLVSAANDFMNERSESLHQAQSADFISK